MPYLGREPARESGGPSALADADLIRIVGDPAAPADEVALAITKTFVVENQLGEGGALVGIEGSINRSYLSFIHSTTSNEGGGRRLVRSDESGLSSKFVSARNIYGSGPEVSLGDHWDGAEVILDYPVSGVDLWRGQFDSMGSSITVPLDSTAIFPAPFLPAAQAEALSSCELSALRCPGEDCQPGDLGSCAPDVARYYLPTPETIAATSAAWPWGEGHLMVVDAGDPLGAAGATGRSCRAWPEVPSDRIQST